MEIKAIKTSIQGILPELRKLGVEEILLFGSQAKGTETSNSDFDFLVSFKDKSPSLFTLVDVQELLSRHFSRPVDVGTIKMLRPELKDQILAEALSVA